MIIIKKNNYLSAIIKNNEKIDDVVEQIFDENLKMI